MPRHDPARYANYCLADFSPGRSFLNRAPELHGGPDSEENGHPLSQVAGYTGNLSKEFVD
jgi:hypothetical protein